MKGLIRESSKKEQYIYKSLSKQTLNPLFKVSKYTQICISAHRYKNNQAFLYSIVVPATVQ